MRASKFFIILFIVLLIIILAAVAALLFVDPSVFRGQLQARATDALGRQVQFIGPISLERSLRPRIIVEDITIGNPEWASGAHFAQVQKAEVQVALIPLLQGDLKVLDVVFNGVNLFIEENPDGVNNYTFGDPDAGEEAGLLPDVEQLQVRDAAIKHRAANDRITFYKIVEARLWNIPGQPERIEGNGIAQGMPFTIVLAADGAAELSGPENPWSVKLDLQGPDMSLTLTGQMNRAFQLGQGNYRISISGKQADSLESLFDVRFPTTGPFDISWALKVNQGFFHLSGLAARVHGPEGTPEIQVSSGEATGGLDVPLQIALQGQIGDTPFAVNLDSEVPLKEASRTKPWPLKALLKISDTRLNIQGAVIPETAIEHFEFDAQLQGETLQTMARLLDVNLPRAGPYQLSFHTQYAEGVITITSLKGSLKDFEHWKTIEIVRGEASLPENGAVHVSMDARLDKIPLSLSLQGGPADTGKAGGKTWPMKLDASAAGARVRGDGAFVITENRKMLQMATRIAANRLESLGPLLGTSLPALGKFSMSANVNSDGDVYEARNLKMQMRGHSVSGRVRWEDKSPRPLLTGKLSLDRLALSEFSEIASKSSSKSKEIPLLDRPINLDWLKEFDARLDLQVNDITGAALPIADIRADVTLTNGRLGAVNRSKIAGVQVDSQIQLSRHKNVPAVSLKATTGRIDAEQILEQLDLPAWVTGTADTVELEGTSHGKTLNAWLKQAAFTLQINPANLRYADQVVDQKIDVTFKRAQFAADKDQPLTGTFMGVLNGAAFNANVGTSGLAEMLEPIKVLPLRLGIQTADVQFKTEGMVKLPFENKQFEFNYELSGQEIQGLEPVAEFVLPLKGAFRSEGWLTADGNKFTYEENVWVGKSDLRADITILLNPKRPRITGSINSDELHLEDIRLFEVDEDSQPAAERSRVIPDYTIPIDALLTVDLELDLRAEKIRTQLGDLGEMAMKAYLEDGRFNSVFSVTGFKGARLYNEIDLNVAADPPLTRIQIDAKNFNYGFWLRSMDVTDLVEGLIDLHVDVSGTGATRYELLANAGGRITVIGGPGKISGRRIDLWAADLIPTMLSSSWRREDVTETNCFVAHLRLGEGMANIEDLLLDTQRITIAASGQLDLESEALDVIIAPRPKRASLVSLANPVRIEGTLSEPDVSVTRLSRRRRFIGGGFGVLAGLVNPAFLALAFSDTGTGDSNPCETIVEQAREAVAADSQGETN